MKFMNRKQVKKINKIVDNILIDWLRTIVPEEDQENITKNNFESMLPESPYKIFAKDDGVSVSLIEYASNAVTY